MPRNLAANVRLSMGLVVVAVAALAGCSNTKLPDVQIVSRTEWAGEDDVPMIERFVEHTPERLTVHHAGVVDDGSLTGDEKMRRLFNFSVKQRPWGDVPYHFVIDRTGCIREGRDMKYAPDTNTSYDVNTHICICVNGDLTKQPLLEAQYRSLVYLLVKLAADLDIPNDRIAGHKDYAPGETTCPGVLANYIHNGWLVEDMESVRSGKDFEFRESQYIKPKPTK